MKGLTEYNLACTEFTATGMDYLQHFVTILHEE